MNKAFYNKKPSREETLWRLFCEALDEGRVSVILENAVPTLDGGEITTQLDDVVEFLESK